MRRLGSWCAAAFLAACNNVPPSQASPATSAMPDGAVQDAAVAPGRVDGGVDCGTSCAGRSAVSAAGSGGSARVVPDPDMDAGAAPADTTEDSGLVPPP